ncbi:peptidase M23 [Brachybacterium phenoliresistens]|uniref:Peptidase M23 n=1 Tax=Brachybacterium phenoliresistens TaxID=396014 RepID=Z9JT36_9MICO|nr:M23 family metallopeptidase [Brachybacterium phenoliresistens]EWS81188.1 peptidase M23 [Brachybacterium phenoliresistens]
MTRIMPAGRVPGARGPLHLLALLALLLAVLVLPAAPAHGEGSGRWLWPVAPPHPVVRPFEAPAHRYAAGHRGIDISGADGTVRAVEDGTVRFAGMVAGRPVLSILHGDGLVSTYEPVVASVAEGDPVTAGSVVGALWAEGTHCPTGPCLHLGARRGEDYLDPLMLLGERGPSVLQPLEGAGSGADALGGSRAGPGGVPRSGARGAQAAPPAEARSPRCAPRAPCPILH